jgi:hypothetical protein
MKTFLHKSAFLFMLLLSLVLAAQTVQLIPNPVATDLGYSSGFFDLTAYNTKLYGLQNASLDTNTANYSVGKLAEYDGANVTLITNPDAAGDNQGVQNYPVAYNGNLYLQYLNQNGINQLAKYDGTTITLIPNPDGGSGFLSDLILYNNSLIDWLNMMVLP